MADRVLYYRWTLVVSYSGNKRYQSVSTVAAASLVDAERAAVNRVRTKALTDPQGIRWDRWTLLRRSAVGAPLKITAHGTNNGTTWTERVNPQSRFRRGA